MSKDTTIEFKINSSPDLKMSEITKRLFNRNFHSDVQFSVEDKIIYAHSLELIKRSVVFEEQLEGTMGDIKMIPITDCKYEHFLEFIRFIYTDEIEINENNGIEILKLATKYKVIILENQLLNFNRSKIWRMKCFEHCIRHKYELVHNWAHNLTALNFQYTLENEEFNSQHSDIVDELLKFERVSKDLTEFQIFNAVAKWIESFCNVNQITLSEGRQRFDNLIKKIRFPTMSKEEIRECYENYPGLLSENDCMSIVRQSLFGGDTWISKCREEYVKSENWYKFQQAKQFKTILSVSNNTILHGLRIGVEEQRNPIEIQISEANEKLITRQTLIFVQNSQAHNLIISLGDSILLKPNLKYRISIKYLEIQKEFLVVQCRQSQVIINDPCETVNLIKTSENMLEMFFKTPSN